jgi:hypothetical protein
MPEHVRMDLELSFPEPRQGENDYRLAEVGHIRRPQAMARSRKAERESIVTSCMPESFLIWQSLIDSAAPPRDPNDEDEAEDEDDREVEEDDQPAVIREPDEDE